MEISGYLHKMRVHPGEIVHYYLDLHTDLLHMNDLLGKNIALHYKQKITCFCGNEVDKVFRQNFCYDCFYRLPQAGEAIFNPEKSLAHLGQADRDLEWEKAYQLQPHVVYLANSGGLKVGVTRTNARLNRWIDQGARAAIVLAETENRFEAGEIEVFLKDHLADKTDWRKMLQKGDPEIDLVEQKKRITELLDDHLKAKVSADDTVVELNYPVNEYPLKVKSLSFGKTDQIEGELSGIRGQYLIFSNGGVFNVRSHEGRHIALHI